MGQLLLVDDDPDMILAQINQVFGTSQHRIEVARTGDRPGAWRYIADPDR